MASRKQRRLVGVLLILVAVVLVLQSGLAQYVQPIPVLLSLTERNCTPWPQCVGYVITTTSTTATSTTSSQWGSQQNAGSLYIADTWLRVTMVFKDGSSSLYTTGRTVSFSLLEWLTQGKQATDMIVDIPATTYDVSGSIPKDYSGQPYPWYDVAVASLTIKVNDMTAYNQQFTGVKSCPQSMISRLQGIGDCNVPSGTITLGHLEHFDLNNWMQNHKLNSASYTLTISVSEYWEAWFVTRAGEVTVGSASITIPDQQHVFTYSTSGTGSATFTIDASPSSISLGTKSGFVDSYSVSVLAGQGFSGTVKLSVTGLPDAVSSIFTHDTAALAPLQSFITALQVSAFANAPNGTYQLTITASSSQPAYAASKSVTLVIQQVGTPIWSQHYNTRIALTTDYYSVAPGTSIHLKGQLVTDPAAIGFAGQVVFTPQWNSSQVVSTNADGTGNFAGDITMPIGEGKYVIVAQYNGDATHSSSSSSITITVSVNARNSGNNQSGAATGACAIGAMNILGYQFGGLVLPDWICGSTFGIANWIWMILSIGVALILLSRRGGGSDSVTFVTPSGDIYRNPA